VATKPETPNEALGGAVGVVASLDPNVGAERVDWPNEGAEPNEIGADSVADETKENLEASGSLDVVDPKLVVGSLGCC
jgi:hypothetical protein